MRTRPCNNEDWDRIIEIARTHSFPFPDFKNILGMCVVEHEGKVVAFGYLKKFVEVVFMPDLGGPKKIIVESLNLLNEAALVRANETGITQLHGFITNENFKEIMIKHFNYHPCKGDALFIDVG